MKNKTLVKELTVKAASELLGEQAHPIEETPKRRSYTYKSPENIPTERLKPYQWKKGQSGNPKGRPVNALSLTALLNKKLAEHPELGDALVDALIDLGIKSNPSQLAAIDKAWERVDGKAVETHRIEGEFPIKLVFMPAPEFLAMKKVEVIDSPEVKELEEGEEGV